MNSKQAEKISKALSDPNRLLILKEIKKQKNCLYCVDLGDIVDLAQPSIAHHLKLLTDSDLIIPQKEGRNVKYTLNSEVLDEYIGFLETLKK
jgi:ArsR family transcriptional regulator